MALRYRTVATAALTETVVRRSRFLSYVEPVNTEEEILTHLERIRKMHPSATHHCYAYQLKEPQLLAKSSDDGEPAGTAGRPILEAIHHLQLHHVLVVVVRYFGGVMLGAGGLIRAYGEAAHAGLAASGTVERRTHRPVDVVLEYPEYGKLEYALRTGSVRYGNAEFSDRVRLTCWPETDELEGFIQKLNDWTNRFAEIRISDEIILDHRVN